MNPCSRTSAIQSVRRHVARLQTSPQFTAVLDVLFELPPRTAPAFAELVLVDGRLLFARPKGEFDFCFYCGPREELFANLAGLCRHLRLGGDERAYVLDRLERVPLVTVSP
jgi:hypothetical protein